MRIGKVIGTVTLSRSHPSLAGASLSGGRAAVARQPDRPGAGRCRGTGRLRRLWGRAGGLIGFSEGGEAAQPFYPHPKPVDAYNAALLDDVQIEHPHPGQ